MRFTTPCLLLFVASAVSAHALLPRGVGTDTTTTCAFEDPSTTPENLGIFDFYPGCPVRFNRWVLVNTVGLGDTIQANGAKMIGARPLSDGGTFSSTTNQTFTLQDFKLGCYSRRGNRAAVNLLFSRFFLTVFPFLAPLSTALALTGLLAAQCDVKMRAIGADGGYLPTKEFTCEFRIQNSVLGLSPVERIPVTQCQQPIPQDWKTTPIVQIEIQPPQLIGQAVDGLPALGDIQFLMDDIVFTTSPYDPCSPVH